MIGWIGLSRRAVASAEQALRTDQKGVRDEVGFLALHQVFSDYLFPGTSVLHTRLRYALFVPWLVMRSNGDEKRLRADQLLLTRQLCKFDGGQDGVIGGTLLDEPSQTATMIYWSAIGRWGLLRSRPGQPLASRSQVLRRFKALALDGRVQVIDGEPTDSVDVQPFVTMPSPPSEFLRKGEPIAFELTSSEKEFMRDQLMGVSISPGGELARTKPSLLARLAEKRTKLAEASAVWHLRDLKVADTADRDVLELACHASALGGIGRAVYSALVESAKNTDTGETSDRFAKALSVMRGGHGNHAKALDIKALRTFAPELSTSLLDVLEQTMRWVRTGRVSPDDLADVYRCAESERKKDRARLGPSLAAQKRRAEWNTPKMPYPEPAILHYRWNNVRGLLSDLTV